VNARRFRFVLLLATAVSAALLASALAADRSRQKVLRARPYRVHAVAPAGELLPHDQKVLYQKPGLKVGIQMLDDRARRVFFRERLGVDVDPFYRSFGEPDRFVSFRLVVAATDAETIYFHPQHIRLVTNKQEHIYPMDLTRVYQYLKARDDEDPETGFFDSLAKVIFDRSETLEPGNAVEKLLVFKEPRPDSREWVLDLPFFQVGKESHSFQVAYAREFLDDD
jgi:hypothetical protein